eukprot:4392011-Pleurochrysis_carterae.AAC.1
MRSLWPENFRSRGQTEGLNRTACVQPGADGCADGRVLLHRRGRRLVCVGLFPERHPRIGEHDVHVEDLARPRVDCQRRRGVLGVGRYRPRHRRVPHVAR